MGSILGSLNFGKLPIMLASMNSFCLSTVEVVNDERDTVPRVIRAELKFRGYGGGFRCWGSS